MKSNRTKLSLVLLAIAGLTLAGCQPAIKTTTKTTAAESWSVPVKALSGFADAEVVSLGDGKYRMYFGDVPSTKNFMHGIFSAISTDGKTWKTEDGIRQKNASFPDVIRLKDGSWRMYFQDMKGILSATSNDGLTWTKEPGVRIDTSNSAGLSISEVGASTTMQMDDGTFVLVYRGKIEETYDQDAPNKGTHLFLWATSKDGLKFDKQGVAIDSRNVTYDGFLDGPDFSKWGNNWRLYYWTYSGVYYDSFDGRTFGGDNLAISAKSDNPMAKFSPNPPGDPSLIKIGDRWFMYYGSFDAGNQTLYYVTLK